MKTIKTANNAIVTIVNEQIKLLGNNANLNHIDVSKVTDMQDLFYKSTFNGDISQWNVSNVKNMFSMFHASFF